jgi:ribosomal protein L33
MSSNFKVSKLTDMKNNRNKPKSMIIWKFSTPLKSDAINYESKNDRQIKNL